MLPNPLLASTPTASSGLAPLPARVLHAMPWGVLALDRQQRLRLLNPAAAQLLGYPAGYDEAALLGQPLTEVLPQGFPNELRAALHAAYTTPGSVAGEFFLPYCQQWLEMTTVPGDAEVLVYWQVVTRLVEKRQQYQALADNTPDALARWDTDGRLCYANPAMEAKLGQPLGALLGKTLRELGLPSIVEQPHLAAVQRVFATGQPQRHASTMPLPQGEQYYQTHLVPEMHDGQVHTVLSIAHNITELRQAELAATAQAYFSAQLAVASPDRILVRELATNKVQYVNRAVLPELGYDPDEALAAYLRGEAPFPGAPDHEAALTAYWQAFATATDEAMPVLEHCLRALDGTWHWYRMRGKVFARDAQGQPTQALSVAANITAEKEAESALRESKRLFEAVFNTSSLGLNVMRSVRDEQGSLTDFEVVLANAASDTLSGFPAIGMRMGADWPHTREMGLFDGVVHTLATGQFLDLEHHYDIDGTRGWYRWTAVRLGDGALVAVEDITARKRAEADLQQTHAQLSAIFEAVPVQLGHYLAVRDAHGQLVDLRSVTMNAASVARMGLSTEAGGQLMSTQLPGLRQLPVWQRMQEVIETGQPQRLELHHEFGAASAWFDVLYTRLGDGLVNASLDITARKQMEQQLRESHDLLQAVFNATLDSLEVLRSVRDAAGELIDFEWVLTNEAAHRLAHRPDLVGKRLLAEEPAMQTSGVFERLCQVVHHGQAADFEQYYPYDGADEWFHVSAAPLGDGLVVSWHDITAVKQAAAELLRLQLAQQQQLANAVLAAQEVERRRIAESLHNGVAQLLYATKMRLDALDGTVADAFAEGKRQTAHLLTTSIAQVRTLSHQLIPTILEDFGLATAMHEICRDYRTPHLRLRCTVGNLPPLPPALALAMYRMAQELANNLVKHAAATEAHLHLREQTGWLELRATDNGHGFDPAQPRHKGLGLNALRDRVQLLSGQLTITSSAKQGTQITIRVPCPAPPAGLEAV
jgi:PAS domain S-box-containing protein